MDQTIIEQNSAAQERMKALVARLSDDDLGREVGEGWTVAALLAHIAFWDRRAAVVLARWSREGVGPSEVDLDAINDALWPQWRLIPVRAAADDAVAAAAASNQTIAEVSAELVAEIRAAQEFRFNRSNHRDAHLDEIEQALAR